MAERQEKQGAADRLFAAAKEGQAAAKSLSVASCLSRSRKNGGYGYRKGSYCKTAFMLLSDRSYHVTSGF